MNYPLEAFDRISIINLPSRLDRRCETAAELTRIGLSFEDSRVDLFPAFRPSDKGEFPSIGARGCFLSHLRVLQRAVDDGIHRLLILEDDVSFSKMFILHPEAVINSLSSPDWAIFYGGHKIIPPLPATPRAGLVQVHPTVAVQTTHCIAFQGGAIRKAADFLSAMARRQGGDVLGGPMHVDGAYSWFRVANPDLVTLAANPPCCFQRSSATNIHALPWFDRVALIRQVVSHLRRIKNRYAFGRRS
jgi:hypothetical protein